MIVTAVQNIEYVDCTPTEPFQLAWLNSLTGTDTWVFSKMQEYSLDVSNTDTFEPIINYLQIANGVQRVLKKDAFMVVKLGYEGLTGQQVIGIKELLISPYVVWLNYTSEMIVSVKPGSFKIGDTSQSKQSLEFEIILPKLYTASL